MELLGQKGYVYLNLINIALKGPQSGCINPIYLAFTLTPLTIVPKELVGGAELMQWAESAHGLGKI